MKTILATFLLFCNCHFCNSQCQENTLYNYSQSIKLEFENRCDSLPYATAICTYFNDFRNHSLKETCSPYPAYFFQLTLAEFYIIQGQYALGIKELDAFFAAHSTLTIEKLEDYLQAILYKTTAYAKSGHSDLAWKTIRQADSIIHGFSNYPIKSIEYKIRNAKASLLLNDDHYKDVASYLQPILINNQTSITTENITYINALVLMGELQLKLNKEDSALIYLKKANKLVEQFQLQDHYEFIGNAIPLAQYYQTTGQFAETEILLQHAETSFRNKIGKDHPEYANILRLQGNLFRRTGRFDLADNFYKEAIQILKKIGFENNTQTAITLTNWGLLYVLIGKRKEAEQYFQLAKIKMEDNQDTSDLDYICTLQNLANLYYNQLKLDEAESLYGKVLAIRATLQGVLHADYAQCLNSLGNIYLQRENFSKAESYYMQAIQIVSDNKLGKKNTCTHFYNNLAFLYFKTKQFAKAETLYLEIKIIYEHHYGKMNRTYLSLLDNLAELYAHMNNPLKASAYFIEASKLRKRIIYDSFKYLAESEVDGFLPRFRRGISNFNKYLLACDNPSDSLLIEAFENELFYKGFLLNYHLELNNIVELNPSLKYLNDSIKIVYKSIAKEYSKNSISTNAIDSLEHAAHQLEKELGKNMKSYEEIIRKIHFKDIVQVLKPKEAIIEILYLNLNAESGQDSVQYAAMIIPYGSKTPILVNLCRQEEIQSMFLKTNTLNSEYVNALYSISSRGIKPIEKEKNTLYELIWKKLENHLKGIQTIYYTPAGLFHNINIQAIPINTRNVVGNCHDFIQLTSSRELIKIPKMKNSFQSAFIMGGIQYDESHNSTHIENKLEATSRGVNTTKGNNWPELNHTAREIFHLNSLFQKNKIQVKKYLGSDASEENFKNEVHTTSSAGIVHIATHGYFFPSTNTNSDIEKNCPFMSSKDPMIRSGLILAFGNHGWNHCNVLSGRKEDGILTALEISQMNLHQTQLAVLSACETGLGEIKGPEGVYGLQRAFKIAGVKYLIMSLWQIPDHQTEELMVLFYSNLLTKKMSIPKAFKKAQMDMKNKYNDPYFWAGFVLVQ